MHGGKTAERQEAGQRLELRLPAEAAGWRLDRALAAAIPTVARTQLKRLVAAGEVEIDGEAARDPARKMRGGERALLRLPAPEAAEAKAEDIPLVIVFEDEHLLVVDKPAGLVVHPAAGNLDGTLVNALLYHCAGRLSGIGGVARPGIVHRIDKDTSGLLVVAKTDPAHVALAAQFKRHSTERRYLAVVAGLPAPPMGRIETNLARSAANRQKVAVVEPPEGRRAVTHYRLLQAFPKGALVECRLETGRTHQVRVHMAHIGHPLIGDPAYGRGRLGDLCRGLGFHRQALHAAMIGFEHPLTGQSMRFESPLPADIQQLLIALR